MKREKSQAEQLGDAYVLVLLALWLILAVPAIVHYHFFG